VKISLSSTTSRIVFLHVVAIALTAIFMPLVLFWLLSQETKSLHQRSMAEQASAIARYLKISPTGSATLALPGSLQAQFSRQYGRYFYAIVDQEGGLVASSIGAPLFPIGAPSGDGELDVEIGDSRIEGVSIRENVAGKLFTVQVGEDLGHRDVLTDDIVANFFLRVSWISIPILLLLLTVDIVIFGRALRPLRRASREAQEIGPSRTDIRLTTRGIPSDIQPLVEAINQALDRLDSGFRVQREFTADAAHELRTPLAILRARLEDVIDPRLRRQLQADIDLMSRIVGQLLEIAELDSLGGRQKERLDIKSLAKKLVGDMAPLAIRMKRQLSWSGGADPAWINGHPEMLYRALRNLVENAIRHTPPGTTVEVSVDDEGTVRISDQGPGIASEERELIFQRFWRRERSKSEGAGLGLSIVRKIVDAHEAELLVENGPEGGAVFKMRFLSVRPTAQQTASAA
jgi:signal transduction histidine kinase|tara:strand:- start:1208 stop:2587 length:1380 start_codon:yes stop_codon:yes gene_type:complete